MERLAGALLLALVLGVSAVAQHAPLMRPARSGPGVAEVSPGRAVPGGAGVGGCHQTHQVGGPGETGPAQGVPGVPIGPAGAAPAPGASALVPVDRPAAVAPSTEVVVPRQSMLVPILMYHHLRTLEPSIKDRLARDLSLPPEEFEYQLRYLKEKGFSSVSMDDLWLSLEGRKRLPPRPVVFTFDDGYRNGYLFAYPLLTRYGFAGTFFVVTDLVDRDEYLTWGQLREMVAAGMEVGSHTVSHADLARVDPLLRDRELNRSKQVLEEELGIPVRSLAYPGGSFDREVAAAARRAGYMTAVTTEYGAIHERGKTMEMSRIRIRGTDTLPMFRWKIEQYFPVTGPSPS